jgi:GNAT superfamily N-acetyltransferase
MAALVALLGELFRIEQDFEVQPDTQRRGLQLVMDNPLACLLVAVKNQTVVGMVSVQLVYSTAEGTASAWLEDVVVQQAWRGQGLGRALLEAALAWAAAQGARRAQLLVDLDNQPALTFYDRLGWESTRLGARRKQLHGS